MAMAKIIRSDDMTKTAAVALPPIAGADAKLIRAMIVMGLIPMGVDLTQDAIVAAKNHVSKKNTWKKIIKSDPSMDSEEGKEIFETMYDLSPSLMKHRTLAIPALRQSGEYSTGGIPPQLVNLLVGTESQRTRGNARISQGMTQGMGLGLNYSDSILKREDSASKRDIEEQKLNLGRSNAAAGREDAEFNRMNANRGYDLNVENAGFQRGSADRLYAQAQAENALKHRETTLSHGVNVGNAEINRLNNFVNRSKLTDKELAEYERLTE